MEPVLHWPMVENGANPVSEVRVRPDYVSPQNFAAPVSRIRSGFFAIQIARVRRDDAGVVEQDVEGPGMLHSRHVQRRGEKRAVDMKRGVSRTIIAVIVIVSVIAALVLMKFLI
jgi:hypothetical protein